MFQHCVDGTVSGAGQELVGPQITRNIVTVTAASRKKQMERQPNVNVCNKQQI